MHIVSTSIAKAIGNENWFAALYMSLTLPGICGGIEYDSQADNNIYAKWFDKNLSAQYSGLLSGEECFLLQQACLYKQLDYKHLEVVERFHFLLPSKNKDSHKTYINGILQLEINQFCTDLINAFELWVAKIHKGTDVQKRLEHLTTVSENLVNF